MNTIDLEVGEEFGNDRGTMATRGAPILTDKEEKQLSKLRNKLFDSKWDSTEFKEALRDLVSTNMVQKVRTFGIE